MALEGWGGDREGHEGRKATIALGYEGFAGPLKDRARGRRAKTGRKGGKEGGREGGREGGQARDAPTDVVDDS
jgi:hypothetical protein